MAAFEGPVSVELVNVLGGDKTHDTVKFYVTFNGVGHLSVNGWTHIAASNFTLTERAGGGNDIKIEGDGFLVEFSCDYVSVKNLKTFKVGAF